MCVSRHPTPVALWFDGGVDEPIEIELELEEVPRRVPPKTEPGGRSPRPVVVPAPRVLLGCVVAVALFIAGVVIGRAGSDGGSEAAAEPTAPPVSTAPPAVSPVVTVSPPPTGTVMIAPDDPASGDPASGDPASGDPASGRPARPGIIGPGGTAPETTRGPNTTLPNRRTVTEIGRPLLPVQTGLRLVGLTADFDVVEVDLDSGRVSTTVLPEFDRYDINSGYLMVGDTVTLVGTWEGAGVMLTEGTDEPGLAGLQLSDGLGSALRGSRPDTFWVVERQWGAWDSATTLRLGDAGGSPVDDVTALKGAPDLWDVQTDHRGGLVLTSHDGLYVYDEAGPRRLTTGRLLALGRRHAVATECDDQLVCARVVIDRDTGTRTEIDGSGRRDESWLGVGALDPGIEMVSPDGTGVVALRPDSRDQLDLALIDLRTGASTVLGEAPGVGYSVGWSADGRFLLYLDGDKLFSVDRPLGTYKPVSDRLPALVKFALRP
jgi:hypothetical protein